MKRAAALFGAGVIAVSACAFASLPLPGSDDIVAARPIETLTPQLKQDLANILAQAKLQQAQHIALHLRFDYVEKFWTPTGNKYEEPPQHSMGEATLDIANKKVRYHVEYKPLVSKWTDGAAPYLIREESEVTDGKQTSWSGNPPRNQPGDCGYLLGYTLLADDQMRFVCAYFINPNRPVNAPIYEVKRVKLDGREMVQLEDTIRTGYGKQQRDWWLDPAMHYAVVQCRWQAFDRSRMLSDVDEKTTATKFQEIAPGVLYPIEFTKKWSQYDKGKLKDTSFESESKLSDLTILKHIDDATFRP